MVEINEIEFIEETEYFKFQHGACFCMLEEEKKQKREIHNIEKKICNAIFAISNVKKKGLYYFNKNLHIFSLSDFLYKIDNENEKINIKSLPFEENVLLIENNKEDYLSFIYTDKQNIYVFDYTTDEVKLYCKTDLLIKRLKHIDKFLFLVQSAEEKIYFLNDKMLYECQELDGPINNMDEKNGVFLFTHSDKETFILKDENKSCSYDLGPLNKEIDITYDSCSIICAKILEADKKKKKKKKKLFIVVLYKDSNDITSITYDIHIEDNEMRRINYSINDFFFEKFDKNNFIKCMYISEWKILVSLSSESCEAIIYTHNEHFGNNKNSNDLKILCIKEGYKINTRQSDTFFLSLFMYTKYVDKIYRKSKIGNVPFLKDPNVFFLLQDNQKIVVEYLDQFKLEDISDFTFNNNEKDTNECEMKEVSLLPNLSHDIVELHQPITTNVLNVFEVKEYPLCKVASVKKIESTQAKKQSIFTIFKSKNKAKGEENLSSDRDVDEEKHVKQENDKKSCAENYMHDNGNNYDNGAKISTIPVFTKGIHKSQNLLVKTKDTHDNSGLTNEMNKIHYEHRNGKDKEEKIGDTTSCSRVDPTKEWQEKYAKIKKMVYEDELVIINKIPDKYNKLMNGGMFMYEDFLLNENPYSIEKTKYVKMSSRKKEWHYDKGRAKIIFLHDADYVGGEHKLTKTKRKNENENGSANKYEIENKSKNKNKNKNEKVDFCNYFTCADFDFYKHKRLSDKQCEKIINKIERKQHFIFDIKKVFLNEGVKKGQGVRSCSKGGHAHEGKAVQRSGNVGSGTSSSGGSNGGSSGVRADKDDMCDAHSDANTRNDDMLYDADIKLYLCKEDMSKFYTDLNVYFSKRKLIKVNNELFDNLKNGGSVNSTLFQIILYNIFHHGGLKYCESFMYFILKNSSIQCFSNAFFLLEHYFNFLITPYVNINREVNNGVRKIVLRKNILRDAPILSGKPTTISSGTSYAKYNNPNNGKHNEDLDNLDSEYSTDSYCEDDIYKKIKNEKDENKKREYLSKIIPLYSEEMNNEQELTLFYILNRSVDFLNNQLCYSFSQKLIPIILDSNLNNIDNDLSLIKCYLLNAILNKDTVGQMTLAGSSIEGAN
ncbi:hypothetical protein MKS88_003779 [Plasmodium brasilianum]|uniref:Uncharacterized protein n=1 Tax=Plasmodium brasilianum TaxID=5824 RepID=A0ACB9Y8E8_PLABR|nr:hypothetical protein MKS88_003779 [Plasmodium brasilianum]